MMKATMKMTMRTTTLVRMRPIWEMRMMKTSDHVLASRRTVYNLLRSLIRQHSQSWRQMRLGMGPIFSASLLVV